MKLSQLENNLNFKFPKKWHEIYSTGAMEWLEIDVNSLGKEEFHAKMQEYYNDPTQFFMLYCDIEPIIFEDIPCLIEELNEWILWKCKDDKVKLKDGVKLFPFAQTGGGDMYCFLYEDDIENAKVAWYYHDDYDTPVIFAENFDEFLYRALLNAALNASEDDEDFIGSECFKNHLGYLTDEYKALVEGKDTEELAENYEDLIFKQADIWILNT